MALARGSRELPLRITKLLRQSESARKLSSPFLCLQCRALAFLSTSSFPPRRPPHAVPSSTTTTTSSSSLIHSYRPPPKTRRLTPTVRHSSTTTSSSSSSTTPTAYPLTRRQYNNLSSLYLDTLLEALETHYENSPPRPGFDFENSAGVLTITCPPSGTYVINKQPPNQQLWLSSPRSGPRKFDWVLVGGEGGVDGGGGEEGREDGGRKDEGQEVTSEDGRWVCLRDGKGLTELLEEELGVNMEDVAG